MTNNDDEPWGDVLGFMRDLWAVDHGLRTASHLMRERNGLTGPQRFVVKVVGRFPSVTAGQIAEALYLHPSTMTGILDRLDRAGIVRRKADSRDRRRARFELTEQGRAAERARAGTVEERVRAVLRKMPERDVAVARRVLNQLAQELTAGAKGATKESVPRTPR